MRKSYDIDPADVDRDGIAEAQQLAGAGNLTLNGALADLGTAEQFDVGDSYSSGIGGVQIGIYSAGNLSGVTFTVTGLDQDGNAAAEDVAGPNNETVETTGYFSRVTEVAADGAVGSDVEVGTVDEIVTRTHVLNSQDKYAAQTVVSALSGTCQYDVDETFDNLMVDGSASATWFTKVSNQSTDQANLLSVHATGVRLKLDSYTDGAELQFTVLQNATS